MRPGRHLRVVFRKLVFASLPMAALGGCGSHNPCGGGPPIDYSGCPAPLTVALDAGTPDAFQLACESCIPDYGGFARCEPDDAGESSCRCEVSPCLGRRPAGLRAAIAGRCEDPLGAYFAHAAHLEAASVHAFRTLRDELAALGAPLGLRRRAERAARDEVRHARVSARLARAHGGRPVAVEIARPTRRSLEELALENAIEGCVRESYGALVATWQGQAAQDEAVRAAMASIADDETRHAELSWSVDEWASQQLGPAARARVQAARKEALRELRAEALHEPARVLREKVGLPGAAIARALLDGVAALA